MKLHLYSELKRLVAVCIVFQILDTEGRITLTNKLTKETAFQITNHDFYPYNFNPVSKSAKAFVILSDPADACTQVKKPPGLNEFYSSRREEDFEKIQEPSWILFVPSAASCGLSQKVANAQLANYSGIIIQKDPGIVLELPPDPDLLTAPSESFHINVSFISEADGRVLSQSYTFPTKRLIYTVEIVEPVSWARSMESEFMTFLDALQDRVNGIWAYGESVLGHVKPWFSFSRVRLRRAVKSLGSFLFQMSLITVPLLFLYFWVHYQHAAQDYYSGRVPPRPNFRPYGHEGETDSSGCEAEFLPQPDMDKYRQVLQVRRGASEDDIRRAYHRLAKLYHSDKTVGQDEDVRRRKEEKFKEIYEAKRKLISALQHGISV